MKHFAGLVLIVTMASSIPVEKNTKAFSIFSVLTFPNDECTTTLTFNDADPVTSGLCLTANECTEAGGAPEGNCASGFGVCCHISVSATNTIISKNITYITNQGWISNSNDNETVIRQWIPMEWTFKLAGGADICFIRLDFEQFVLNDPLQSATSQYNGFCGGLGDELRVIGEQAVEEEGVTAPYFPGFSYLCGTLTGHHIYIQNSIRTDITTVRDVADIQITIGGSVFDRRIKIKTSRIECDNPNVPDVGCLQWLTGPGGRFQSLNYGAQVPISISGVQYSVCIRKEEGFCGFSLSQARRTGTPDPFNLIWTGKVTANPSPPTDCCYVAYALTDEDCNNEFISVASSTMTTTKFCGGVLASENFATQPGIIHSDVLPFRVNVAGTADNDRYPNTGLDLTYKQTPC